MYLAKNKEETENGYLLLVNNVPVSNVMQNNAIQIKSNLINGDTWNMNENSTYKLEFILNKENIFSYMNNHENNFFLFSPETGIKVDLSIHIPLDLNYDLLRNEKVEIYILRTLRTEDKIPAGEYIVINETNLQQGNKFITFNSNMYLNILSSMQLQSKTPNNVKNAAHEVLEGVMNSLDNPLYANLNKTYKQLKDVPNWTSIPINTININNRDVKRSYTNLYKYASKPNLRFDYIYERSQNNKIYTVIEEYKQSSTGDEKFQNFFITVKSAIDSDDPILWFKLI